ncbi:4a-hydroxytetrahydrobiopterin dehydratase [Nocardioides scoriae]|uniref:Putative pterin-4-alpha-carbinolamine dehydratase n=1 Tax=Nocardioides scoriae TaxID=642780 RepID=A0A1H1Y8U7_9ACTN|nr:4a-hydroxytetrahydrobiopterin dehydratase [Nocardioides scoriae]SDT17880.1 4a-hydroxytetrahydrobiopterin dehydratase [Nocardioides scoriae]
MAVSEQDRQPMRAQEVTDAVPDGWRVVLDRLVARFETGDFNAGTAFVQRVAEVADAADHHPDVDLRYPHVSVALRSHDVDALTRRDVALAVEISRVAAELGVPVGTAPDVVELALDTADHGRVSLFYAALLGYDQPQDDALADPASRTVPLWFQDSDSDAPDRQRWHLDVSVPHDRAQARLDAVLAAGGRLVDDSRAPAFWVLEDTDGNRSCICTWQARD